MRTKYVKANIGKTQKNCKSRLCGDKDEMIIPIVREGTKVPKRKKKDTTGWERSYTGNCASKWYMQKLESVQENKTNKTLNDFDIQMDPFILARRTDAMLINVKQISHCCNLTKNYRMRINQ